MAIKTQMRLVQITGSYGTGKVNDQLVAQATGSQNNSDLNAVLSSIASSIKRIHGHDSHSENLAGVFAHDIIGSGSIIIKDSSGKQVFRAFETGPTVTMGSVSETDDVRINFASDSSVSGDNFYMGHDNSESKFVIGGGINAVGTSPALEIDQNLNVIIPNNATINGSTTIAGDLTVNGTTTTINTVNMTVQDKIIELAKGTTINSTDAGILIKRGTGVASVAVIRIEGNMLADGEIDLISAAGDNLKLHESGTTDSATEASFSKVDGDNAGLADAIVNAINNSQNPNFRAERNNDSNPLISIFAITDTPDTQDAVANSVVLTDCGGNVVLVNDFNDGANADTANRGGNVAAIYDESDDAFKFLFTDNDAEDLTIAAKVSQILPVEVQKLQISGSSNFIHLDESNGQTFGLVSATGFAFDAEGNGIFNFTDTSAQAATGIAGAFDASSSRLLKVIAADGTTELARFDDINTQTMFSENVKMFEEHKVEFRDADASLGSATTAGELVYSGSQSFIVAHTTPANTGLLKIQKGNAAVGFDFAGDTSITYSWPNAPAANDYVLQAQTDGTLAWVAQGGAANSVKTYASVAGDVAANTNLSSDSGYTVTDYSAISTANAAKAIDVYVNGQLLQSGSGPYSTDVSAVSFTSGDYLAKTLTMNALDIKFSFALEADDVVCIIGRA